jgi:hypothetical protein
MPVKGANREYEREGNRDYKWDYKRRPLLVIPKDAFDISRAVQDSNNLNSSPVNGPIEDYIAVNREAFHASTKVTPCPPQCWQS